MRIRQISQKFLRFVVVGIIALGVNFSVFQLLIILGSGIYIATLAGNLTSILVNFSGLSTVFNSKKYVPNLAKYLAGWISYYFLTVWILNFALNFGLTPIIGRLTALALLTPVSFLFQKYIVFK